MTTRRRFRLSHATVVAYISLFLALGGTTYAASTIAAGSIGTKQLHNGAVTTSKLAPGAVATHAIHAASAHHATSADHATDADQLGGAPPASYRLHCPGKLSPAGDICFEFNERAAATFDSALMTCARAQMRLPDAAELALVYDHLGASQQYEWIASPFFEANKPAAAVLMGDDATRTPTYNANLTNTASWGFRCVTSPTN